MPGEPRNRGRGSWSSESMQNCERRLQRCNENGAIEISGAELDVLFIKSPGGTISVFSISGLLVGAFVMLISMFSIFAFEDIE